MKTEQIMNEKDTIKSIEEQLSSIHASLVTARDAAQAGMAQIRDIRQFIVTSEIARLKAAQNPPPK